MLNSDNDVIDELNSYLRGEMSAVETYRQAIDRISSDAVRADLAQCLTSHEERVGRLTQHIERIGGEPATGSGAWGTFAQLVEGGAGVFGERAAIAALEEGEDHGRDDYKRGLDKIGGGDERVFIEELLAEQLETHAIMSRLSKELADKEDVADADTDPNGIRPIIY